jgi:REP element-mobilizing transposase RayT
MSSVKPLLAGQYYHLYNRGNNGETIFVEERNFRYFLKLYAKYVQPIAETFAYCLMPNHFHFLIRIRDPQDCQSSEDWQSFVSLQFRNLFSTYTKAVNKAYGRSGSLFEKPFKRKRVDNDRYFIYLIAYIHRNPQHHGFVDDFREWPWSSYGALLSDRPTRVQRDAVLGWFGDRGALADAHRFDIDQASIAPLIVDDWL